VAIETEKFVITEVDAAYSQSREITTNPKPPQKTGISAATVFCKSCENLWHSRSFGDGSFNTAIGFFIFECPKCHASEGVKAGVVMGAS